MHKRAFAALTATFVLSSASGAPVADAPGAASTAPAAEAAAPANLAPLITVPPASVGAWYDLGAYRAPWLAGDEPVPVAGPDAPTRVAGWRREANPKDKASRDEWLAIVIVQVAPGATAPCSTQATSLDVKDAGAGCLRLRRNADFDRWMQAAQPALYRWVDDHGWTNRPRAWAGYRLPSANGRAVEVHVLFDPSLIEPILRNSTDFVTSGLPGQQWARQLAAAVRAMDGTAAGNVVAVPPFPFAPAPRAEPEMALPDVLPAPPGEGASAAPAATRAAVPAMPAVAEQITPPEPPQRQNRD